MDTQNPSLSPNNDDHRPSDQQERAANAQPNPNDPMLTAPSPNYGTFGHPNTPTATTGGTPGRSGANDNPDEFAELNDREQEAQNAPDNAEDQPGHIEQNQNPGAIRAAQGKDDETQRAAWAADDPRYAGGGTHNTREEAADANYPTKDE